MKSSIGIVLKLLSLRTLSPVHFIYNSIIFRTRKYTLQSASPGNTQVFAFWLKCSEPLQSSRTATSCPSSHCQYWLQLLRFSCFDALPLQMGAESGVGIINPSISAMALRHTSDRAQNRIPLLIIMRLCFSMSQIQYKIYGILLRNVVMTLNSTNQMFKIK